MYYSYDFIFQPGFKYRNMRICIIDRRKHIQQIYVGSILYSSLVVRSVNIFKYSHGLDLDTCMHVVKEDKTINKWEQNIAKDFGL